MSLIVEDGTAKVDAESYATAAQFKTYFNNRGIDIAAYTDARIEQLLRIATDYMLGQYRLSWKGTRVNTTQALDWPRYNVKMPDAPSGYGSYPASVNSNVVPKEVITACIVLAYKAEQAENNELAPDVDRVVLREKIDVIEVAYDPNAAPVTSYRSIGAMLSMYFGSGGNSAMVSLVRC